MELIAALFDLCSQVERPIISIDGPAGAGKTTLARHISRALSLKYSCTTLHMDDLYHGWESAFDHHLSDALTSAVNSHRESKKYAFSRFNWSTHQYDEAVELPTTDLLILEGVGSAQSLIRPYLTVTIWIDIEPEQGLERVLARDGNSISAEMQQWLSIQAQHFLENETKNAADFLLTN